MIDAFTQMQANLRRTFDGFDTVSTSLKTGAATATSTRTNRDSMGLCCKTAGRALTN
ncbi:MAG: hypothetical protein ABEI27_03745 [Halobellus sp.]|uniref:hypothetical protein n=1 Tax=Halobellus sp. TaxID=1979212 RepID=UPI0035D49395